MGNRGSIRFIPPEGFETIVSIAETGFPSWLPLVLRTYYATGCRPAEIAGKNARQRREPEEGFAAQSAIREHHGLRAQDVLSGNLLHILGKNTNGGKGRAKALKPREVVCAQDDVYRQLVQLAATLPPSAHLFGLGPNVRPYMDGYWQFIKQIRRLRRHLPRHLEGFQPRWLRHSWAINALRGGPDGTSKVDLVSVQRQLGHADLGRDRRSKPDRL